MEIRKLQKFGNGESGGVTLPKDDLRDLGLVSEDGLEDAYVGVERVEAGEWRVELVEH